MEKENVNHPKHYNSHPSGVECIDIIRHYDFNIGSAIKYLWRHGLKVTDNRSETEMSIEDLKKAVWYIEDEIKMLENVKYKINNKHMKYTKELFIKEPGESGYTLCALIPEHIDNINDYVPQLFSFTDTQREELYKTGTLTNEHGVEWLLVNCGICVGLES